jgi:N-acetyl-anhydromuramyl-L-alanine amidase AmpD
MHFIGIEAENTGLPNDSPWPQAQMDAYHRGVAAILSHLGQPADSCAGHKEYALPARRKSDPSFDMVAFRAAVTAIMSGAAPAAQADEPPAQPDAPATRPTLRRGANGESVRQLQTKLGVNVDGSFGAATEAAVREFQTKSGITADGVVGAKTWQALDGVL